MTNETSPMTISVILLQEGEWWSAQCLEFDIAAQAKTLPELRNELKRVLLFYIASAREERRQPFESFQKAPQAYWDMFAAAKLRLDADELPFHFPEALAVPPVLPRLRVAETQAECVQ